MNKQRGGFRSGAGRTPLDEDQKKIGYKVYLNKTVHDDIITFGAGDTFSEKVCDLVSIGLKDKRNGNHMKLKFIDLFAGLGGIRIGFENACKKANIESECVLTSEIKPYAIEALKRNFNHTLLVGDITKVDAKSIPDFDILLGGFPCQAFSSAGKGHGFLDTRGTLFFEIERIINEKQPIGFILENVEGLVLHDRENNGDKIGRTLETIILSLEKLNYKVSWKLLDSKNFGVPQSRKRVYIVGTKNDEINLTFFESKDAVLSSVLEMNLPTIDTDFSNKLLSKYSPDQLYGKSIKDKRGGEKNIHSWDIGIKGDISDDQKELLNTLLKERRKKHWAEKIGIDWMDGMPLTLEQISSFYESENLKDMLDSLVKLGYLTYEHPKKIVRTEVADGKFKTERMIDSSKPKGYNIVSGKLSFEFSKILDPQGIAPTLVAMDMCTLGVIDNGGIRNLTLNEGLRIFGYPKTYDLSFLENSERNRELGFDLLGNTVTVPVIEAVAERLISKLWLSN